MIQAVVLCCVNEWLKEGTPTELRAEACFVVAPNSRLKDSRAKSNVVVATTPPLQLLSVTNERKHDDLLLIARQRWLHQQLVKGTKLDG